MAFLFLLSKKFDNLLAGEEIDLIHCYDGGTALIAMMLPRFRKIPIIHTKCGGPNERWYFAQVLQSVILFSQENMDSFKSNPRFKRIPLHLIPNRVHVRDGLTLDLSTIPSKDQDKFTFLRIARIGKTYKNSIMQAIELVKALNSEGQNVKTDCYWCNRG
jgi:hypothetical protein